MDEKAVIGVILMVIGGLIILFGVGSTKNIYGIPIAGDTCLITAFIGGIIGLVGLSILGFRFRKWAQE